MKREFLFGAVIFMVFTVTLYGESLDVPGVIEQIVSMDPDVVGAELSSRSAYAAYQETLAGAAPDISIDLTPYSLSTVRVNGYTGSQDLVNHSLGAGLSVTQALPTSGFVTAGINDEITVQRGDNEVINQVPSVSVTLDQHLFVDGKLISTSVYEGTRRNAEIGYLLSEESRLIQMNSSVRSALGLYVQALTLQRSLTLIETTIDVLTRQIEDAQISLEQGLITDNTILALRITLNSQREAQMNTRLALVQVGQGLARSLGMDRLPDDMELDAEFPSLDLPEGISDTAVPEENPQVAIGRYGAEQADLLGLFNDLTDRPHLSVVFQMEPIYPDNRDSENDFAASFTDYFDDGSTLQTVLSLNLSVPVLTKRERDLREEQDRISVEQSRINLDNTRRLVANQLQTLLLNRQILQERMDLLQVDVAYEEERVQNEQTLLDAGASTHLKVDEVRLDLLSRRNEQFQVSGDLFLNTVDILSFLGADVAAYLTE